VISSGSISTL